MSFSRLIQILITTFYIINYAFSATDKVICYYESWEVDVYPPEDINIQICTHINYAFMGLNDDGSLRLDDGDDVLRRISNLKNTNPNLKVLISIGGWNEGSVIFSQVAADAQKKANMAGSANYFLDTYNYDGIDVDWEYPAQRNGTAADKENFIDMLWVLRNSMASTKLLTLAVSSDPNPDSYNVPAIMDVVDYINVMTYDFHQAIDGVTGQNSPLYASHIDNDFDRTHLNCDASITNWLNAGGDPNRMQLGLAFYGHSFELADWNNHELGAPVVGDGLEEGYLNYKRICMFSAAQGWVDVWDDEQKVPIKYAGNQWIGFDNVDSIALKVQYAKSRGLGGVMIWAVDGDDKDAICGVSNPLINEVKNNL